ncbi:MAG: 50S ribosomal protein L11 methyltransferase [Deltaproteobacteria bacterium]|nr:50S ribosomal protein L11 methyltransferase [Deltaproteobacteria bacterium]
MNSEQKNAALPWWELVFSCSDADDFAASALGFGASGAHLSDEHHVTCYLQAEEAAKDLFCAKAQQNGGQFISAKLVEEKNWNATCPDLWERLQIGTLEIVPVATENEAGQPTQDSHRQLRIVPGTGFGTGHHPTTSMIIELLQAAQVVAEPPKKVLDVGTGSGILAIAAWKLFGVPVEAVDIDPLALENAATNATLNHCSTALSFSTTPASALTGRFNLILANIYAEVLQSLRPDFQRLLAADGTLIVSGIMLPLASQLQQDFEMNAWKTLHRLERLGWVSFVFKRA